MNVNPLHESLINWDDFWHAEYTAEWLIEPLFAARRSHALYAGAKTGKSYVVLAACDPRPPGTAPGPAAPSRPTATCA